MKNDVAMVTITCMEDLKAKSQIKPPAVLLL